MCQKLHKNLTHVDFKKTNYLGCINVISIFPLKNKIIYCTFTISIIVFNNNFFRPSWEGSKTEVLHNVVTNKFDNVYDEITIISIFLLKLSSCTHHFILASFVPNFFEFAVISQIV